MTDDRQHDEVERWSAPWAWLYATVWANPRSNRVVAELAAPGPGDTVVDVGCGAGAAVRAAAEAGAGAIGVDPSPSMVRNAARRHGGTAGARFVEGDAADLPLDDDSATIAWAIATYHHWPDRRAGLEELRRVLRPGGRLLLGEKRLRRPGGHGLTRAEADDVAGLLRQLGYRDVTVTSRRLLLATLLVIAGTG
jgi:ubiquinone/menaquinone biosynthesis C-methylase UbiE